MRTFLLKCIPYILLLGFQFSWSEAAFISIKQSGTVNYPESTPYHSVRADLVGRIFLAVKGYSQFDVYTKFGSKIDVLKLNASLALFVKGGDFTVNRRGEVHVVDAGSHLMLKFNNQGLVQFSIGEGSGGKGTLRLPRGIELDSRDYVYVADTGNKRVQIFNPDGIFVSSIESGDMRGGEFKDYRLIDQQRYTGKPWPSFPILKAPKSVVLQDDKLMVLDDLLKKIFIFSHTGQEFLGVIPLTVIGNEIQPLEIKAWNQFIFVLDEKSQNIKVYGLTGEKIQEIGSKGTREGEFYKPISMDIKNNRLYVLDSGNSRVQVFDLGEVAEASGKTDKNSALEGKKTQLVLKEVSNRSSSLGEEELELVDTFLRSGLEKSAVFQLTEEPPENAINDYELKMVIFENQNGRQLSSQIYDPAQSRVLSVFNQTLPGSTEELKGVFNELRMQIERFFLSRLNAPGVPKGLTVIPGVDSFFIRWEKNPEDDVIAYRLYQAEDEDGPYRIASETHNIEFESQGAPGQKVFFRISALDSEGKESEWTPPAAGIAKPKPDFGFMLKIRKKSSLKKTFFEWNDSEREAVREFQVFRSESPSGPFEWIGSTPRPRYEDTGLIDGKTYFYKIRKVYTNGVLSDFSNAFSCSTEAPPSMIKEFKAESDLPQKIRLSWRIPEADSDIRHFIIHRSEFPDGPFKMAGRVSARKVEYTDSKLKDNTTYYYKIKAVDRVGLEGEFSDIIFGTTKMPPLAPKNLIAESGLPRQIKLSFEPLTVSKNMKYIIYRGGSENGSFDEIGFTFDTVYFDRNLEDFQEFYYFVAGKDEHGLLGEPSDIVYARTKALPKQVRGLKVKGEEPAKITLLWESNPEIDIRKYEIFGTFNLKWPFSRYGESETTLFTYDNEGKGLKNGSVFYFKVRAVSVDGLEGEWSSVVSGKTRDVPPRVLTLEFALEEKAVLLTWPPVEGDKIFGYKVYRDGQPVEIVKTNFYRDETLVKGQSGHYSVSAIDIYNLEGDRSDTVKVKR